MTISHNESFTFELTDKSMVSDFLTKDNLTEIIIILPEEDYIMSFNGDFQIEEIMVTNSYNEINIIMRGDSLNNQNIKNVNGPTFLVSIVNPIEREKINTIIIM